MSKIGHLSAAPQPIETTKQKPTWTWTSVAKVIATGWALYSVSAFISQQSGLTALIKGPWPQPSPCLPQINPRGCADLMPFAIPTLPEFAPNFSEFGSHLGSPRKLHPDVFAIIGDDGPTLADIEQFPLPTLRKLVTQSVKVPIYTAPMCTPSRAALMTGQFAFRTGLVWPLLGYNAHGLPLSDLPTFPQLFKNANYTTELYGKWHLGYAKESHLPTSRGFDTFLGFYNGGLISQYSTWMREAFVLHDDKPGDYRGIVLPDGVHSTEIVTQGALRGLHEAPLEKPLLQIISFTTPHAPLEPTPENFAACADVKNERRRRYCGELVGMDKSIARILAAQKKREREVVISFFPDNGPQNWAGGLAFPYRSGKASGYEGGGRVDALFKAPNLDPATEPQGLFAMVDVGQTLLSLAQQEAQDLCAKEPLPRIAGLDSLDQSLALQGQGPSSRKNVMLHHESIHLNNTFYLSTIDGKVYKLLQGTTGDGHHYQPSSYWIKHDATWLDKGTEILSKAAGYWGGDLGGLMGPEIFRSLRECAVDLINGGATAYGAPNVCGRNVAEHLELFDLSTDPYEYRDLASSRPKIVSQLKAEIALLLHDKPPQADWTAVDSNWHTIEYSSHPGVPFSGPWLTEDAVSQKASDFAPIEVAKLLARMAFHAASTFILPVALLWNRCLRR
jgi:arylsulfatase A-like enzyme